MPPALLFESHSSALEKIQNPWHPIKAVPPLNILSIQIFLIAM